MKHLAILLLLLPSIATPSTKQRPSPKQVESHFGRMEDNHKKLRQHWKAYQEVPSIDLQDHHLERALMYATWNMAINEHILEMMHKLQ
jgi:hypothetical protein